MIVIKVRIPFWCSGVPTKIKRPMCNVHGCTTRAVIGRRRCAVHAGPLRLRVKP